MPSHLHQTLVGLFFNQPELTTQLVQEQLAAKFPAFSEARVGSAALSDNKPAAFDADLAVMFYRDGSPVYAVIVEAQLAKKARKRMSWPVYATTMRARHRCPATVLVVTPYKHVAHWAATPIELGGGNWFTPWVLGPSTIPKIVDLEHAVAAPELAVLSAITHAKNKDAVEASHIAGMAMTAVRNLDQAVLYGDVIWTSLSKAARRSLQQAMDLGKYEFKSDFAKKYIKQGRSEGIKQGRAEALIALLDQKFGALDTGTLARIHAASERELERWNMHVLSATSLEEVLKVRPTKAHGARTRTRRSTTRA